MSTGDRLAEAAAEQCLAGVRVLDFTASLAGPLATMVLAELGADVVKVENMHGGDMAREVLPWAFTAMNPNKRSIALDLKSERGRQVGQRLVAQADVVVSSFRAGVMGTFGFGAEELMARNPGLIYAILTGYGETGPRSHRRGMDTTIRAECGIYAAGDGVTSMAIVDFTAGLSFANAVLGGLVRKARTGQGALIQARLADAGVFLQAVTIAEYAATGKRTHRMSDPTVGSFPARDGDLVIAVYTDRDWARICSVLGLAEAASDERFATRAARRVNAAALRQLLENELVKRTRQQWVQAFDDVGVMVGSVQTLDEVFHDQQFLQNRVFYPEPQAPSVNGNPEEAAAPISTVRPPFWIDREPLPIRHSSPGLGEHTREILEENGFSADEIDDLHSAGAVGCAHEAEARLRS
jgi:crotonobetainyl-CoA:carnitine CoA-transferase CaiB-like acyl-CoA transferase